jgi:hypothetical protein
MYEYDRATERIFTLSNPYLPDQDMYLHRPEVSWASVFSLQNETKINSDSLAEYFYSGKTPQDNGDTVVEERFETSRFPSPFLKQENR